MPLPLFALLDPTDAEVLALPAEELMQYRYATHQAILEEGTTDRVAVEEPLQAQQASSSSGDQGMPALMDVPAEGDGQAPVDDPFASAVLEGEKAIKAMCPQLSWLVDITVQWIINNNQPTNQLINLSNQSINQSLNQLK